ncbi:hypothetical protein K435DRAFT_959667 [Dendrothele bispora CBS 962.96]|uniref:RRM domain-containing protein n=1 Tax=Dendrothele bispora (strain CBS 962.96) TaxID=1314807 RepID=A0A4S8MW98_DENBC|nr:hypothetical protein K435DRAFT_959667 [Dendrothele bispora CBS 962.96]
MPHKFSARPRAWGTRFDSLPPSSPPPSSKATESDVDQATTVDVVQPSVDASNTSKKDGKMSHDASIFVGSLPVNVEPRELSRLLSQHLADYGQVKSVKVIRDSKGGVCAFVQCEDPPAAANLIHTLHASPPRLFLGRHLRYEFARAFRSLLISYCIPIEKLPLHPSSMENKTDGKTTVELELPFAMRIWKLGNTKTSILYNNDAVDANLKAKAQVISYDRLLHLEPVQFDSKTLEAICVQFGPLEYFKPFQVEFVNDSDSTGVLPFPHNGPRKPNMDTRCFEIKWLHRDDAVSAYSTLRSMVPHLNVSWLHQHMSGQSKQSYAGTNGHLHTPPAVFPSAKMRWPNQRPAHGNDSIDSLVPTSAWLEIDRDFPPLGDSKLQCKVGSSDAKPDMEPSEPELFKMPAEPSMASDTSGESQNVVGTNLDIRMSTSYGDEQNGDTPQLGMSPVTPKTPASGFPPTPTSSSDDYKSSAFPQTFEDNQLTPTRYNGPKRLFLDPTTLFVGGLEMYGPGGWDETKLQKFFERFGGLESVKMIRPTATGRTAFAFVKFDNTKSPTQAIIEENNQVYQGRTMRVQLRDCNPTRGNWKPGRGRGRFMNQGGRGQSCGFDIGGPRTETEPVANGESMSPPLTKDLHLDDRAIDTQVSISDTSSSEGVPAENSESPHAPIAEFAPPEPTPVLPSSVENFREWYETEDLSSTAHTPLSSGPFLPEPPARNYHLPSPNGYYPGAPWVSHYPPYSVPYVPGYPPIYPIPNSARPPPYTSSNGSDASGPTSGPILPPNPWPGMYGAYIPYPTYPSKLPTMDHSFSQPPVVPQGFIQNEQGTLIAVYRPEAIDRYLQGNQTSAHPQVAPMAGQVPPPSCLPNPQVMQNWTQYPQCPLPILGQTPSRPILPVNSQIPTPVDTGMANWVPGTHSVPFFPRPGPPPMGLPMANAGPASNGNFTKRGRKDQRFTGNRNNRHGQRNGRSFGDGHQNMGRPLHVANGKWNQ